MAYFAHFEQRDLITSVALLQCIDSTRISCINSALRHAPLDPSLSSRSIGVLQGTRLGVLQNKHSTHTPIAVLSIHLFTLLSIHPITLLSLARLLTSAPGSLHFHSPRSCPASSVHFVHCCQPPPPHPPPSPPSSSLHSPPPAKRMIKINSKYPEKHGQYCTRSSSSSSRPPPPHQSVQRDVGAMGAPAGPWNAS